MRAIRTAALALLLGGALPAAALAVGWYVPVSEQVPGGFDHIQIQMLYPYYFDSPAISAFFGSVPGGIGEDWSQTFLKNDLTLAAADGPDMGSGTLYFSIWIGGDRLFDRPAFHFQAYKGEQRVDNADFICFGPDETDWMVAPGTWMQNRPIPPYWAGDLNLDGFVGQADLNIVLVQWGRGFHGAPPVTDPRADANKDGLVGQGDLNIVLSDWGMGTRPLTSLQQQAPEPCTLTLIAAGAIALLRRRGGQTA